MSGKITLRVIEGPLRGRVFTFERYGIVLFGRQEDCQICLDDDLVSRHHCMLEVNPPQVCLRDLGSRNGTFVNGVMYGGRGKHEDAREGARRNHLPVDLKHDDLIRIGGTVLRLEIQQNVQRNITLCQRCGKDVSTEVAPGQDGQFLCASCRLQMQTDPAILLLTLVEQKRKRLFGGIHLSDYAIQRKIGAGGMGAVYLLTSKVRSRDPELALKVMLPKTVVSDYARESFRREIESTRLLKHPNIVTFHDGGVEQGIFYCLLEYCQGGSIMSLMKQLGRPLKLSEAGPLMIQVLKGLAYMHQRGYVHRDLKPQNILLSGTKGQWQAKIADLGLAKNFLEAGLSGLTLTNDSWAGSFDYMPREQAIEFRFVKPSTDIWAIGATFYTMLTGRLPRPRSPGHDLIQDQVEIVLNNPAVPLLQANSRLPPALARIIDRTLELDPADRYQSGEELLTAMQKVLKI